MGMLSSRAVMTTRLFFALLLPLVARAQRPGELTALDKYVQAPDPSYKYELVKTIPGEGYTAYVLDMTSQTWRSPEEVDRTVWKHWLTIVKPDQVATDIGFLFITGGSNRDKAPERADAMVAAMAANSHAVTAELRMVPNQPLEFGKDGKMRVEDSLIAYTWRKFLQGGDDLWLARMPMTKAAVRAMDTVTAFCAKPEGGNVAVARYVVAGGSKRGWTTYTTAAVDKRVVAIAPIVIDLLNVIPSFKHHWQAYGFWAPAVKDYVEADLMGEMNNPRYHELMRLVEPYSYRERYTMPKFLINSAGDQFFLPDSWQFYWNDLIGEKHIRYVPNSDHSLRGTDSRESLAAFFDAVVKGKARPRYDWKVEKNGEIHVKVTDIPKEVKLWQATNPEKRDFRLESIKAAYSATPLQAVNRNEYVGKVAKPEKGWTAYFVELTYDLGGKYPMKVTSGVHVTPETLPFPAPK